MDAFPNSICICTCMVLIEVWFSFLSVCFIFTPDFTEIHNLYRLFMCSTDWENLMDWFLWCYWINSILSEFYYNITNCYKYLWVWKSEGMCNLYLYAVFLLYIKFHLCIYTSKLFGSSIFSFTILLI